jgi:hypothetical protein
MTLLLGIAIGVLGAGALQERRVARVNDLRRPGGFVEHVQEVIQPTSDSQWQRLRPFIEATAAQNGSMRHMHDSSMHATLDTLRARLNPMLDARQRERLSRFAPRRDGGPQPRNDNGRRRPRDGALPRDEDRPPPP